MNFHAKSGICSSKNCWVMSTYVLFYVCNLFGIFIRTTMQNLESEAQKMSELCSIQCAMPVTNPHVAVWLAISGSFLNWHLPDRFISFIGRYLRPLATYKNGLPLTMFILKRGLIWDYFWLTDTSSDMAIVVEIIREFCAFQSEWHMRKLLQLSSY